MNLKVKRKELPSFTKSLLKEVNGEERQHGVLSMNLTNERRGIL
jgi:hypothetical protein